MGQFLIYFLVWWVLFFVAVPIGIKEKKKGVSKVIVKHWMLWKIIVVTILTIPLGYLANHYLELMLIKELSNH